MSHHHKHKRHDDDEALEKCPYCGHEIFEGSPRCPHCHKYISEEDIPTGRKPWWFIIGACLALFGLLVWSVIG